MRRSTLRLLLALTFSTSHAFAQPAPPPYETVAYRSLGIWTEREFDRRRELDLRGTDLGVSFPFVREDGRRELIFLFGDTHEFAEDHTGRFDEDSIARVPVEWDDRRRLPKLGWLTGPSNKWLSLLVPGEDLRGMEVPLDGVQVGERVVLFFNADWDDNARRHRSLVCAFASGGRFDQLEKRFKQPSEKFLNVSVSADPADPQTVWIFGTGTYRRSPIHLAKAAAATLDDFNTWQFRAGNAWVKTEAEATPIIDGRMGELSARFVQAARSWVLLYQRRLRGARHQGVFARFASTPTGPWSDELPLIEPNLKRSVGFAELFHGSTSVVGFCDGLSNPRRDDVSGDPYGPYLVPEWCYMRDGELHLVHALSTWNPYQSSLVDAVVRPRQGPTTAPTTMPAMDELISAPLPNEWAQRTLEDGRAERSSEWTVGDDQLWITFRLNAPGVVARLFDASGERVRESRSGEQPAVVREVRWRVDSFAGQRVQLRLEMPHSGEKAGGMPEVTLHRRR